MYVLSPYMPFPFLPKLVKLTNDNNNEQVYCKKCYENRKCTKNTGFKHKDQGSSASGAAGSSSNGGAAAKNLKVLCAVDDCTTDVSFKTAWVGLFL